MYSMEHKSLVLTISVIMGKTFAFQQGNRAVKAPISEFTRLFGPAPEPVVQVEPVELSVDAEEHSGSDSEDQPLSQYLTSHPLLVERDVSVTLPDGSEMITTGSVMKVSAMIPGFKCSTNVVGYRSSPLGKKVFGPRKKGAGGFHSHPRRLQQSLGKKRRYRGPYREYAFDRELDHLDSLLKMVNRKATPKTSHET